MEISAPTTINFEVYVDPERCTSCGICISMCSMGVFVKNRQGVYHERSQLCCSCFKCNEFCPAHAISTRWIVRA